MKKYLVIAVSAFALASCSNDTYLGENVENTKTGANDAIAFTFINNNFQKAGDLVGSIAATKLQDQFVVYGTKHSATELADASKDELVFNNYKVEYTANTAGHTQSNTQNWDYVGLTPYDAAKVSPKAVTDKQTIKYWDYSAAAGYTFYGIASKTDIGSGKVVVGKTTTGTTVYDKGYSVTVKNGATLNNLYVADRTLVAKADYQKPVSLKFRNFGARVRAGFYETIPGYSVTINKFYVDDDADPNAVTPTAPVTSFDAMVDANTTNFAASLQNIKTTPSTGNILTVSYYNGTNGPENQVKVTPTTVEYNWSLVLGAGVVGSPLAETSAAPTWDKGGDYTPVYPFEDNTNPMLIKVDYTLTSTDGSDETIEVTGATAVVPAAYCKWKSNFAYTYIFKISDNTNGKTDPSGPAGLYPITFDAVVVAIEDDKTQQTITTFEDYPITTYQNGSKVEVNNEYKKGTEIYVVKTNTANPPAIQTHSGIGTAAGNAQVYTATTTGDAISETTIKAKLNGLPNGITLTATTGEEAASLAATAPAADGTNYEFGSNGAVKFTPSAAGNYVYVSTRTARVAPTYTAVGSGVYSGGTTYYFKTSEDVFYAAPGINAGNFEANKANLYTKTGDGTEGAYDIKVIKVVN